ncbi:hypothetical protein HY643_01850 [Candidatus Woesearchaeota archaeon]|nr:hypothetical protein [Candidatus Woesearchaeota archaeon]
MKAYFFSKRNEGLDAAIGEILREAPIVQDTLVSRLFKKNFIPKLLRAESYKPEPTYKIPFEAKIIICVGVDKPSLYNSFSENCQEVEFSKAGRNYKLFKFVKGEEKYAIVLLENVGCHSAFCPPTDSSKLTPPNVPGIDSHCRCGH